MCAPGGGRSHPGPGAAVSGPDQLSCRLGKFGRCVCPRHCATQSELSITTLSRLQGGQRAAGLVVLYLVGAITMVVAILGAYGAHKENKCCLIIVSDAGVDLHSKHPPLHSLSTCSLPVPPHTLSPSVSGLHCGWRSSDDPSWTACCCRPSRRELIFTVTRFLVRSRVGVFIVCVCVLCVV